MQVRQNGRTQINNSRTVARAGTLVALAVAAQVSAQTAPPRAPLTLASTRIVTKDVPKLTAFYEMVTGIAPVGTATYEEIRTPGSVLAIASEESVRKTSAGAAVAAQNHTAILEFEVADVDAERARLDALVGKWVLEPTNQPWGNRSMLLRDPDGNLINIYTKLPKAKLASSRRLRRHRAQAISANDRTRT